jgi:hypothetical protein
MKNIASYTFRFFAIVGLMTLFSGCFMFHKKNRCGDCPKWKIELTELFLK